MGIKGFFHYFLSGVAATLGTITVYKGIEIAKDPVKKEKFKQKIKSIKDIIKKD